MDECVNFRMYVGSSLEVLFHKTNSYCCNGIQEFVNLYFGACSDGYSTTAFLEPMSLAARRLRTSFNMCQLHFLTHKAGMTKIVRRCKK